MNSREKYFNTINFDMYSAQWSHGPVVVRWPIEDTVPTFLYRAIIFSFFPLNLVLLELRSASGSSRSKKFRSALIRIRVRLTKILASVNRALFLKTLLTKDVFYFAQYIMALNSAVLLSVTCYIIAHAIN